LNKPEIADDTEISSPKRRMVEEESFFRNLDIKISGGIDEEGDDDDDDDDDDYDDIDEDEDENRSGKF